MNLYVAYLLRLECALMKFDLKCACVDRYSLAKILAVRRTYVGGATKELHFYF